MISRLKQRSRSVKLLAGNHCSAARLKGTACSLGFIVKLHGLVRSFYDSFTDF